MKLVIAVVSHDDANAVTQNLTRHGFSSTKLSTTGGFLLSGNATLLVGVEEEKVQQVIDLIREYSHSRKQVVPGINQDISTMGYLPAMSMEVTVGGATVFVVDVERFERL